MQVCLLPPGINQLTRLTVQEAYKVTGCIQMFEKANIKKKIMHDLQNMFYFKRGKHSCRISKQCFVSIFGKFYSNVCPKITTG